jgi:hypothetical protein
LRNVIIKGPELDGGADKKINKGIKPRRKEEMGKA